METLTCRINIVFNVSPLLPSTVATNQDSSVVELSNVHVRWLPASCHMMCACVCLCVCACLSVCLCVCGVRVYMHDFVPLLCALQLSVTVSYQATVGTAKLSVVDKDQGVTTKSIRWAGLLGSDMGGGGGGGVKVGGQYAFIDPPFPHSLDYPNRSKDTVEADQHTKVAMTFSLLNKDTSEQVTVHQVRPYSLA